MSIEVNNESGEDVDEPALAALARFVLDRLRVHPLAELSVLLVDIADDDAAARAVDGRAGPDRRAVLPDGRAAPRHATTRSPSPACSATSCSARRSPPTQAAAAGHSSRGGARPAGDARHPAPARLRPRRAGRGARDVRPAGRAARATGAPARRGERRRDAATSARPAAAAAGSSLAGLFAGAEAALSRVSRVAAEELRARGPPRRCPAAAGPRRPGPLPQPAHPAAGRVPSWSPRCWSTVAAARAASAPPGRRCSSRRASMVLVSYVAVGVSPRTLGRQHPAPVALAGGPVRATRWPGCSARCRSC